MALAVLGASPAIRRSHRPEGTGRGLEIADCSRREAKKELRENEGE